MTYAFYIIVRLTTWNRSKQHKSEARERVQVFAYRKVMDCQGTGVCSFIQGHLHTESGKETGVNQPCGAEPATA